MRHMADNIDLTIDGITKTIATREVAGVHAQVFGLMPMSRPGSAQ
jgi:hypothetical protein